MNKIVSTYKKYIVLALTLVLFSFAVFILTTQKGFANSLFSEYSIATFASKEDYTVATENISAIKSIEDNLQLYLNPTELDKLLNLENIDFETLDVSVYDSTSFVEVSIPMLLGLVTLILIIYVVGYLDKNSREKLLSNNLYSNIARFLGSIFASLVLSHALLVALSSFYFVQKIDLEMIYLGLFAGSVLMLYYSIESIYTDSKLKNLVEQNISWLLPVLTLVVFFVSMAMSAESVVPSMLFILSITFFAYILNFVYSTKISFTKKSKIVTEKKVQKHNKVSVHSKLTKKNKRR